MFMEASTALSEMHTILSVRLLRLQARSQSRHHRACTSKGRASTLIECSADCCALTQISFAPPRSRARLAIGVKRGTLTHA